MRCQVSECLLQQRHGSGLCSMHRKPPPLSIEYNIRHAEACQIHKLRYKYALRRAHVCDRCARVLAKAVLTTYADRNEGVYR